MDVGVPETFLPAHYKVVGAQLSKNKRLDRNASRADLGIADDDAGLEARINIPNLVGDDFQIHVRLFEHEILQAEDRRADPGSESRCGSVRRSSSSAAAWHR